jgi:hypothetical protein
VSIPSVAIITDIGKDYDKMAPGLHRLGVIELKI